MGPLIQIAIRLLSQSIIILTVSGLSFLGYGTKPTIETSTSTPTTKSVPPLFLNIEDGRIDTTQKQPEIVATSTKKIPVEKKQEVKKEITKSATSAQPNTPTQQQTPVPATTTPSLKNLPVPNVEFIPTSKTLGTVNFGTFNNTYKNSGESVVNILCISSKGNLITVSTGSGVIIHPQGIILTNAHVAERMLVPNEDCTIRQGEIATDKYKASLVYINESWLSKNAGVIFSDSARGTGENDFALLAITTQTDSHALANSLSFSTPRKNEFRENDKGEGVLAAGYPVGTLGALSLRKFLSFTADTTSISDFYTFNRSSLDILETKETKVGQRGSSGGGIFSQDGTLEGLIVSTDGNGASEKINALTLPYINRTIKTDTGKSLEDFISTDKISLISSFLQKQNSLFEYVKPYVR